MKKPLFDCIDRQIMRENNSLYASRMLFYIAQKRLEKEFLKTPIGLFIIRYAEWLKKTLQSK